MARTKQTARRTTGKPPYAKPTASWSTLPQLASKFSRYNHLSAGDKFGRNTTSNKEVNSAGSNSSSAAAGSSVDNNKKKSHKEEDVIVILDSDDEEEKKGGAGADAADVGILATTKKQAGDSASTSSKEQVESSTGQMKAKNKKNEEPKKTKPTTRFDVFQALHQVDYPGTFCAGGDAKDILPSIPGLVIDGIGPVPLPLSDAMAKTLLTAAPSDSSGLSVTSLMEGPTHRNTYAIPADKVTFSNPSWKGGLDELLDKVCALLGADRTCVTAKLESLLIMEKGSTVNQPRAIGDDGDDDDDGEHMGTLIVQLPSIFRGGNESIRTQFEYVEEEYDDDEEEGEADDEKENELLHAVDMLYIAADDKTSLTAQDVIRSLVDVHSYKLDQAQKQKVGEYLSDLLAVDEGSGNQPSEEVLVRAVNLLFLASDDARGINVGDVCRSVEEAHRVKLDEASNKIITQHLDDLLQGKKLPIDLPTENSTDVAGAPAAPREADANEAVDGQHGHSKNLPEDGMAQENNDNEIEEEMPTETITKQLVLKGDADDAFGCRFTCYFADCDYRCQSLSSGRRLVLSYSLCYNSNTRSSENENVDANEGIDTSSDENVACSGVLVETPPKPTARLVCSSTIPLKNTLDLLPRSDRIFLVPLEFLYDSNSLVNAGIDALFDVDRRTYQSLKVATETTWKLLVIEAEMVFSKVTEYEGDLLKTSEKSKLTAMVGDNGEAISPADKEWIEGVVDFNSCERNSTGMMLSYDMEEIPHGDHDSYFGHCNCAECNPPDYTAENVWGVGKSEHDSEYHEIHHYGRYRDKTTYRSNFLLAFDVNSAFELKLQGGVEAISDAIETISLTNDYSLLKRLMDTVAAMPSSKKKLPEKSCCKLMSMVMNDDCPVEKDEAVSFAKVLLGNFTVADANGEPSQELFRCMSLAIPKIGWQTIILRLSRIFDDRRRKGKKLFLSVPQFVRRVDFIFDAKYHCSQQELDYFLKLCVDDLTGSSCNYSSRCGEEHRPDSDAICLDIEAWVKKYGWRMIEPVALALWEKLRIANKNHCRVYREECRGLINMAQSLLRLYSGSKSSSFRSSVEVPLRRCTRDFIAKIEFPDRFKKITTSGQSATTTFDLLSDKDWVDLFLTKRTLFEHASPAQLVQFGQCLANDESKLSNLLKTLGIDRSRPHPVLRDVLNKCFFQITVGGKWKREAGADPFLTASLHVKKVLSSCPRIASERDLVGRLPLHNSVSCYWPKLENVMEIFKFNTNAGSTIDPVTGLYPFMLAARHGSIDVAFRLLQEDPNLVSGGIPADSRKRKRAESKAGAATSD